MKSLFKSIVSTFTQKVNTYLVENIFGLISATKMKDIMGEVNSMFAELFAKTPVKFAKYLFSSNKVLSSLVAESVHDTVELIENDVICLRGQTNPTENGLWLIRVVSAPVRPDNYLNAESQHGALILVLNMVIGVTARIWISVVSGANITVSQYEAPAQGAEVPAIFSLTGPDEIANAIEAGHNLEKVTLINNESFSVKVTLGISALGTEFADNEEMLPGAILNIPAHELFSTTADTPIFFTPDVALVAGMIMIVETKFYYTQ